MILPLPPLLIEMMEDGRWSHSGTEIAINRIPGDDIAIALDYRTSMTDPRVIGTEWIDGTNCGCFWREISSSFTALAKLVAEWKQAHTRRWTPTPDPL